MSFFCYCYCDRRDLHSFPTRRSSDLVSGRVSDVTGAVVPGAEIRITNIATSLTRNTETNADGYWAIPLLPPGGYSIAVDRKSTRLNSSHSQISYAVFCLKKKKMTRTPVAHSLSVTMLGFSPTET